MRLQTGFRVFLCVFVGLSTLFSLASVSLAAEKDAPVDFARQVRPILSDRCFRCHGPDANAREGDLRLDLADEAAEAISADDLEQSAFLHRISSDDSDEVMPPPDSKLTLSPEEIEILTRWVTQGGKYEMHWAYAPLRDAQVPKMPQAMGTNDAVNEIDHFVRARLAREKLQPSPVAEKTKLIRRVTFDLTGLPPTIEELDAFLADESPEAYRKVVDRLLKSKKYGERMASDWMDLARYSDTFGYQVDRERYVWPWRDWVVKSFNRNMRYDEFITWQLAGDLLPDATDEQILATTFNRLHSQKVEGGTIPEELRTEYVADRTHTFGTAFLGLTLECSRCHDHKYDPIAQRDYYSLFAFFNNIDESGLYSYSTKAVPTPTLTMPIEKQKAELDLLTKSADLGEVMLYMKSLELEHDLEAWLSNRPAKTKISGEVLHLDFEEYKHPANKTVEGHVGKGVLLTGDDPIGTKVGNFRRFDPFSISLWMQTPDVKDRAVVFHRSGGWTDAGSRGYQMLIEDGHLSFSLIHFWPGNAIRLRMKHSLPKGEWHHVTVTYDGSSKAAGLKIFLDGKLAECETVRDHLHKNISGGGGDNLAIGARNRDRGFTKGRVDEFRVFDRQLSKIEVADLHDGRSLGELLARPVEKLAKTDRELLSDYYFTAIHEELAKFRSELRTEREKLCKLADSLTEIMVMRDLPQRRDTFIHKRGAYDAPGEKVAPSTPAMLPPFPQQAPKNRLGLARWLTESNSPLTARVAVNHYWQLCFGEGLVRTPEDFGSQGKPPTHGALLDYLAQGFIDSGWDVQWLLRKIVMSATYRQSSDASAVGDPLNLLLTRSPRYRLTAEMIRDNVLLVSGLLKDKIGGPPVRPYEVGVSFKPVKRDKGEGLYRRSLYTFWKRTAPAPVMRAFDTPSRDVCTARREQTITSQQWLVMLNATQFVEASRKFGERMLEKHGDDLESMFVEMFRLASSRRPTPQELKVMKRVFEEQREHFEKQPEEAKKLLAIGEAPYSQKIEVPRLAAACVLGSILLNFDEGIIKY